MGRYLRFLMAGCLAMGASAAAVDDRAAAEAAISEAYRAFQDSFARKDVTAMYANCDSAYQFVGANGEKSGLEENKRAMEESLGKLRSIHVTVEPEAAELVSATVYMVRYRQTNEILFPLKTSTSKIWFEAEDTWEKKGGKWRLASTHVVNDSIAASRARLEAQKKQMQAEDDAWASRRCLNGLGYGCSGVK